MRLSLTPRKVFLIFSLYKYLWKIIKIAMQRKVHSWEAAYKAEGSRLVLYYISSLRTLRTPDENLYNKGGNIIFVCLYNR